jgi:hypothetical protein
LKIKDSTLHGKGLFAFLNNRASENDIVFLVQVMKLSFTMEG